MVHLTLERERGTAPWKTGAWHKVEGKIRKLTLGWVAVKKRRTPQALRRMRACFWPTAIGAGVLANALDPSHQQRLDHRVRRQAGSYSLLREGDDV
jgi:hypothetical protein